MSVAAGEHLRAPGRQSRRPLVITSLVFGAALILIAVAVAVGSGLRLAAVPLALLVFVVALHERLFAWHSLLALTILVILFVPIGRYTLPASLPFELELYRVVIAAVAAGWLASLLIDPRVRLRKSAMDAPIAAFLVAIMLSIVLNLSRVESVSSFFDKAIMFFASFFVTYYMVVGLARRPREIDFLVRTLVTGGAVLGAFAIIESRTGFHPFNHLKSVMPFLDYHQTQINVTDVERGGNLRVYASAQHPIALGAAFAVLFPLAVYLCQTTKKRRWWLATLMILFGLLAAQSRTAILMLFAIGVVYVVFYGKEMRRHWPILLPALAVIHVMLPGTLGTVKDSFFPKEGLVASQANRPVGSGRVATFGPALRSEFLPNPILGEGFATRVTRPTPEVPIPNGPILDDQWLGLLLQTGVVGTLAFLWLFVRAMRRMGGAAKGDPTVRKGLLVATTASVVGYGVGMFTYDSFSFIQVTFLFFIVFGLGAATMNTSSADWEQFGRQRARPDRQSDRARRQPTLA
jgi:polysaccharide biosynthesis protein PslJ